MKQGAANNMKKEVAKPSAKTQQPLPQQKQRVNERLQPKKYVLQVFDGSQYRPISPEEFETLAKDHPEIAKYFEDENEVENIQVPSVDESVPIYYHWEKVSTRMMNALSKHQKAWIFNEPVDPKKL